MSPIHKKIIFLLNFALAYSLFENKSEAGLIKITNSSQSDIRTEVIPEPSSASPPYCWKCLSAKCQQAKEIVVPGDALCGADSFSLEGTEGGILFNGRCQNLSVTKNYEVSFFDTTLGIGCKSREI